MIYSTKKNFIDKILFYLVLCVPVLLSTGPFLPDLFLSISSLIFVIHIIGKKKVKIIFNNLFFKLAIILWLIFIISALLGDANNYSASLRSAIFYIRFSIFVLLLNYLFVSFDKFKINFIKSIFLAIIICVIFATFEYLKVRFGFIHDLITIYKNTDQINFLVQSNALGPSKFNRLLMPFSDWQVVGSFLLRMLPIALIYIFLKKNIFNENAKKKIFFQATILLTIFIIFMSGERASAILLVFELIIIFLLSERFRKIFKFLLPLMAILILVLTFTDPITKGRMIQQTLDNLKSTKEKNIVIISEIHQGHFIGAWKIFLDNKFFGSGPKGFRYECFNKPKYYEDPKIICTTHPHNTFLQFMSEFGIAGMLFYFFILSLTCIELFKYFKRFYFDKIKLTDVQQERIFALTAFLTNIWPLTTSGSFYNNWLSILYYLPIIFIIRNTKLL